MDEKAEAKRSLWEVLSNIRGKTFKMKWMNIMSEMKINEVEKVLREAQTSLALKIVKIEEKLQPETEVKIWLPKDDSKNSCVKMQRKSNTDKPPTRPSTPPSTPPITSPQKTEQKVDVEEILEKNEIMKQEMEKLLEEIKQLKSDINTLKKKVSKPAEKKPLSTFSVKSSKVTA